MSIALERRLSMIFLVVCGSPCGNIYHNKMGFPRFTKMQTKIDGLNPPRSGKHHKCQVLKSFVREDFEQQKFAAANSDLAKTVWELKLYDILQAHYESLCIPP